MQATGITITTSDATSTTAISVAVAQLSATCCIEWTEPKEEPPEQYDEPRLIDWKPFRALRAIRGISRQLVWMVRQLMHGQK